MLFWSSLHLPHQVLQSSSQCLCPSPSIYIYMNQTPVADLKIFSSPSFSLHHLLKSAPTSSVSWPVAHLCSGCLLVTAICIEVRWCALISFESLAGGMAAALKCPWHRAPHTLGCLIGSKMGCKPVAATCIHQSFHHQQQQRLLAVEQLLPMKCLAT